MQKSFSQRLRFWQGENRLQTKPSQPPVLGDDSEVRAPATLGLRRVHTNSLDGNSSTYQHRSNAKIRRTSLRPREKRVDNFGRFRAKSLGARHQISNQNVVEPPPPPQDQSSSARSSLDSTSSSVSSASSTTPQHDPTLNHTSSNIVDEDAQVSHSTDKVTELSNFYQGFMLFFQLLLYFGAMIFAVVPKYPSKYIYWNSTAQDFLECPVEDKVYNPDTHDEDDWTCKVEGEHLDFEPIKVLCPNSPFECEYVRDFITQTYLPTLFPIVFTTALLTFLLKPRKNNRNYLCYLYGQFIVCILGSIFFLNIGYGFTTESLLLGFGVSVFFLGCLHFIVRVRKRAAKLPDYQLDDFLVFVVFKGGILIGVTQLMFLGFAPLQCIVSQQNLMPWVFASNYDKFEEEATDEQKAWKSCRRSIYSTTGLALIVSLYTLFQIVAAVVPYKIMKRHVLPAKKLIEMNMPLSQAVEVVALVICASCALFLLGFYGAEGNFGQFGGTTTAKNGTMRENDTEKHIVLIISAVGFLSLLVTSLWQAFVIRNEWKHVNAIGFDDTELHSRETPEIYSQAAEEKLIEEEDAEEDLVTSKIWMSMAVACTTIYSGINVLVALTHFGVFDTHSKEEQAAVMRIVSTLLLPMVLIFYTVNLFVFPRRKDPKFLWWLRFHFFSFCIVSEFSMFVDALQIDKEKTDEEEKIGVWSYLKYPFRAIAEMLAFHFGLKVRAHLRKFRAYDLNTFLINTILYGGLQTAASVVFVTFRVTKCVFEVSTLEAEYTFEEELLACAGASSATSWIGIYLLMWWVYSIIRSSVITEFSDRINVTIKHVAQLKMGWRRRVQGCLMILCAVCASFLFSLTEKIEADKSGGGENKLEIIEILGYIGVSSAFISLASEWHTVTKAVRKERKQQEESQNSHKVYDSQVFTIALPPTEIFVSACSWIYIAVIYVLTSAVSLMYVAFAVFSWRCEDVTHERLANSTVANSTVIDEHEDWVVCKDTVDEEGMRFSLVVGNVVMPISFLLFVVSILMRPKETNPKYMKFLYLHFFTFAFVVEFGTAFGFVAKMVRGQSQRHIHIGETTSLTRGMEWEYYFITSILRLLIETIIFQQLLKVRERLAKLSREELSTYLTSTVLSRSSEVMLPIMFLLFECLSCLTQHPIIELDSEREDWEVCASSTNAASMLSIYLVLFNLQTLISKSAPRYMQDVKAFTFESIATLSLRKRHRAQIALYAVTAFCSLYLFGVLGVETKKEHFVMYFGYVGVASCVTAIFMDSTALTRYYNKKMKEKEREEKERRERAEAGGDEASEKRLSGHGSLEQAKYASEKKFSSRNLQDKMVLASLV